MLNLFRSVFCTSEKKTSRYSDEIIDWATEKLVDGMDSLNEAFSFSLPIQKFVKELENASLTQLFAGMRTSISEKTLFVSQRPVACRADARKKLERLCRYVARPPLALERLSRDGDGLVVHELKRPFRDGTTEFPFEPLDFLGSDWLPSCRAREATLSAITGSSHRMPATADSPCRHRRPPSRAVMCRPSRREAGPR